MGTHSAIIALNGGGDFEGGGTYFCSIGRSLLAPKGHALLFEGGRVRHGGDPIISGVRYIIPAVFFTTLANSKPEDNDKVVEPMAKKPREAQGVLRKWF